MWGVCLKHPLLFYAWNLSYTPCAVLCEKFVLDTLCYYMWGVSILCGEIFTCPMLLYYAGSFSYMPLAVLGGEFLLHAPCCFMWGVSLTHSVLFYVGCFSYITGSYFYAGSLFSWDWTSGIYFTHPMQVNLRRFSNSMQCIHSCEVSFILPMLFYVEISLTFYVHCTSLYGEFLLHTPC